MRDIMKLLISLVTPIVLAVYVTLLIPFFVPLVLIQIIAKLFGGIALLLDWVSRAVNEPLMDFVLFFTKLSGANPEDHNLHTTYSFENNEIVFYKDIKFYQWVVGVLITISTAIFIILLITNGIWFI